MKNLFAWITDVHISIKNLSVSIEVLREALQLARDRKVPLLISGDLNDTKAVMRSEWVKALLDLFDEFKDVTIIVLTGNHDLDNKNSSSNSLEFLRNNSNVILIAKARAIKINDVEWYAIPYQPTTDQFRAELNEARRLGIKKLIAHQGVLGAHMGDYIVDESSISPEEFADFEIVLLGHYHKYQSHDNYMYGGSPFTVNHGESGQRKFIHTVSLLESGKINVDHFETKARRHIKYIVESDEDLLKIEPIIGSIAQVILKGPKEFVKKHNDTNKFKKITGAESVSIVPEISRQSEHRIAAEILHSPVKVIDMYLQSAETQHNKDRLKDFLFNAAGDILTSFTSNTSKSFQATRVTGKNFLSFKDVDFNYIAMGLTLVEGYDEDKGIATGAGKSSFFDLLIYGIFGQTSKDIKADEVINRIAKKDCEVITYLKAHDGEYIIKRYRKHKVYENDLVMVLPNGKELRGKDNRETQKMIEQELGCSFDLYLKSSYFTQFGAIDRFLSANDAEKKKLISEITDLTIYDNILAKIKLALTTHNADLVEKEKALLQAQTSHDTTYRYLDQEKVNENNWISSQTAKIKKLFDDMNYWEHMKVVELGSLEQMQLGFEGTQAELRAKANEQHLIWESSRQERIRIHEADALRFNADKITRMQDIDTKSKTAQENVDRLQSEIIELEKTSGLSEQVTADLAENKKKLDLIYQLKIKAGNLTTDIYATNAKVKAIGDKFLAEEYKLHARHDGECPTCHQAINPELIQGVLDGYRKEMDELEASLIPVKADLAKVEQLIAMRPALLLAKDELDNKIARARGAEDVIRSKKNEQTQYTNLIKSYGDQRGNINVQKSDAIYKIQLVEQEISPFFQEQDRINAMVNPHIAAIERHKAQINPYSGPYESEQKAINPYTESVAKKEKDMQWEKTNINGAQFNVNCVKLDIAYGEWWRQALHVYIKSYLMDSCLDQINDHTNEYLQTLFDGILQFNITATTEAGKDTKEKIDISIINNGDECSYQSLSGGERCRICLAVNLALSQIISKTNGKNFGMIFLDEILNGLDEVGKTQSMKLLKELELVFPSVFIIDHAEGFKSLFTNSIMIKKKDKISTIV